MVMEKKIQERLNQKRKERKERNMAQMMNRKVPGKKDKWNTGKQYIRYSIQSNGYKNTQ